MASIRSTSVVFGAHSSCQIYSSLSLQCRQRLLCRPGLSQISSRKYSQKHSLAATTPQRNVRPRRFDSKPSSATSSASTTLHVNSTAAAKDSYTYPLTQSDDASSLLNPPSSTRPPPLTVPPWDDFLPMYKSYYRLGKAYLTFYKSGFKQIKQNYDHLRALPVSWHSRQSAIISALKDNRISRAQFHIFLRFRSDIRRLPLFALLFLACGEFTPLLVPFMSPIVPRTLWLPGQVEKNQKKQSARLPEGLRTQGRDTFKVMKQLGPYVPREKDEKALVSAGARVGAWGRFLDPFIRNRLIPSTIVKGWIEATATELRLDDWAIERDGGANGLNGEEVRLAVERRGIDVRGRPEVELRMILGECGKINRKDWTSEQEDWLRIERIGNRGK